MPRRRFVEMKIREDVFDAAVLVGQWGYPRKLGDTDMHIGAMWWRFGDDVIFWLQKLEDDYMVVHLASKPEARIDHGADARRLFHAIEFIGDLLRCRGLLASDCTTSGKVASYLQRLGWKESPKHSKGSEVWYVRDLRGVSVE